jgi:hypothetical protein
MAGKQNAILARRWRQLGEELADVSPSTWWDILEAAQAFAFQRDCQKGKKVLDRQRVSCLKRKGD